MTDKTPGFPGFTLHLCGENPERLSSFPKLLIGLALLVFAGYFLIYSQYAFALFRFPFDYDQGEGYELVDTILFSQGQWPYRDIDQYPFYSSNYPPVFHLVTVPLVWLFGPHYWTGRLVSYLGTLITAAAIGYAVQRAGKRGWLSVLSGLAFLASNYVYQVGPLFRQHMFMVMFETLAVVCLTIVIEREESAGQRNNRGWLLVMLLLLLAGYTKQLAYATVIAVFLFLGLRQWRRAALWAVPFALVTGLIFLGINMVTDGNWLLNTITANINPFVPGQAQGLFRQWFSLHSVITVVALLMAVYQLYFERLSLFSVWFVVAVINSVTAGKWGAGPSYFATAIAASCILSGMGFSRLLDWSQRRPAPAWRTAALALVPLLFLLQAHQMFHMPTHTPLQRALAAALGQPTETMAPPQTSCSAPRPPEAIPYVDAMGYTLIGRPPTAADRDAGIAITQLIAQGDTPAFSEEAGFNLYLGRDVITNPTQLLNLYHNGYADLTEMLDRLDRQQFDTIVLRAQFYPPPVLDVIGQRYETKHLVQMNGFVYCIMQPKGN
ncbi:MAG: hypothetical protein Fur0021_32800 [Candidatus Promineifilaceae bacterium]